MRLLFDENYSIVAVIELRAFAVGKSSDVEIAHVLELQGEGVLDDEWVPRVCEEGWIVISGDRGKKSSPGSKLPLLCKRYKVTHILLSGAVHGSKSSQKFAAITSLWEQILECDTAARGSEFLIKWNVDKTGFLLECRSES